MPFASRALEDGGVVDEVAEDREGAGVRVLERERDGIANAETHAEVGRPEDAHALTYSKLVLRTLQCKVDAWNWREHAEESERRTWLALIVAGRRAASPWRFRGFGCT